MEDTKKRFKSSVVVSSHFDIKVGMEKNLFLTEVCSENLQELTRIETHVYRKTTNTLIVAKTINV